MFKRFKNWIRKIVKIEVMDSFDPRLNQFLESEKFQEFISKQFQMAIAQAVRHHNETHPLCMPSHPELRQEIGLILEYLKLEIKSEKTFGEPYFPYASFRLILVEKEKETPGKKKKNG